MSVIFSQMIRFGMVGVLNTILSYVVYCLALRCGLHYQLANVLGFFVGVSNGYFWSNRFVFCPSRNTWRDHVVRFAKTVLSYSATGVFLNGALLFIFIDMIGRSYYEAQIFSLAITVPLNFILNKYWAFRNPL